MQYVLALANYELKDYKGRGRAAQAADKDESIATAC
jgi:hypothetical protein